MRIKESDTHRKCFPSPTISNIYERISEPPPFSCFRSCCPITLVTRSCLPFTVIPNIAKPIIADKIHVMSNTMKNPFFKMREANKTIKTTEPITTRPKSANGRAKTQTKHERCKRKFYKSYCFETKLSYMS